MAEKRRRVLVGAGSFADAQAALEIVERLLGSGISDIGGVFLEDSGALDTAAPRARALVTARGSILVDPSHRQLRLLWQGDARAFRDRLMRVAKARAMRWSFERLAGDIVSGVCGAAKSWDWLLIGHSSLSAHTGRVVAIPHQDGGEDDVMALAERLAQSLRSGLLAIDDSLPESEILLRLGAVHAEVVVIDASAGPFRTAEQIRRLLDAARCPVLVLGAAGIGSLIDHSTQIPPPPEPVG